MASRAFQLAQVGDTDTFFVDAANSEVGIGTTSPSTPLHVNGAITAGTASGVTLYSAQNSAFRDNTNGASTMYFDVSFGGASHGAFDFRSSSSANSHLYISTSGTVGIGTQSPSRRLDVSGQAVIRGNTTSAQTFLSTGLEITYTGAGIMYGIGMRPAQNTTTAISFHNAGGGQIGSISQTTSATSFNTSSDYRLKENIVPLSNAVFRLEKLKPSRFNFKFDSYQTVDGFIAHEVADVVPEAVTGAKDDIDDNGNIKSQGLDVSKLVPLLTAALQEAFYEIRTLKQKVLDLERRN